MNAMNWLELIPIIDKVLELIRKIPFKQWLTPFIVSVTITILLMGLVRPTGIMQAWELRSFDRLLRLRPEEEPDSRLLIVTVERKDIEYQDREGMKMQGSLADRALAQLLEKLKPHNPAVIGLDIYRNPPIEDPDAAREAVRLRDEYFGDRFIDVCEVADGPREVENSPEVLPPPGIPLERVGFSDLAKDNDLVVRRQIFGMSPHDKGKCSTTESFSFLIARRYLTDRDFEFKQPSRKVFQIDNRAFQQSELHTGGYHDLNGGGFEVLLNYRSSDQVAPRVSLSEILDGSQDTELRDLVKGKIVLIGTIDMSYGDGHLTPYSYSAANKPLKKMPGVEIQAHMVSQIVSAVRAQRAVLWWLPQWGGFQWGDFLVVWICSFIGGVMLVGCLQLQRYQRPALVGGTAFIIGSLLIVYPLYQKFCLVLLSKLGLWLPLVPSVLAWLFTAAVLMVIYIASQLKPK